MATYQEDSWMNNPAACFVLGIGVGAAVAIMFAPASGSETRQKLSDSVSSGKQWVTDTTRYAADQVSARSHEAMDKGREIVDRGRQAVNSGREQVTAAVDAGRQAYREAVSRSDYHPEPQA